jgi:hypothetical protein
MDIQEKIASRCLRWQNSAHMDGKSLLGELSKRTVADTAKIEP